MSILNDEQLERFKLAIQADDIWHDFFYTELTTGLRLGEICGLMWSDYDERSGTLQISRTLHKEKGGKLVAGDTKTYAGTRKITLPPSTAKLLKERKRRSFSPWIFHDPLRPEAPVNPSSAYRQLKAILKQADLPDLRHTFATNASEHGMDIKTLSTIIGHVSSATTLNVYAHVTDDMRKEAALKINQGINPPADIPQAKASHPMTDFKPQRGKHRYWGNGYLGQKNGRWVGQYTVKWPDGRKETRRVSADTEEECEKLLAEMVAEMKADVATERRRLESEAKAG